MPKVGIIFNDLKPVACQVATDLQDKLTVKGWTVILETGRGGLLGYSEPERPVCHTRIEHLIPPQFDENMDFAIVLGGDGTVLSAFRA